MNIQKSVLEQKTDRELEEYIQSESRFTPQAINYAFEILKSRGKKFSEKEFVLYDGQDFIMMASAAEMAGKSYFYIPIDTLASKWFSAASFYYGKDTDNEGVIRCSEKLAIIFTRLDDYDRAIQEYEKALSFFLIMLFFMF